MGSQLSLIVVLVHYCTVRKLVQSFTLSTHKRSVAGNCIARGTEMLAIMKYMNGGNTGIFKKNGVCSFTHPHENSGATSVHIEKATYQMNSVSGGREHRSLWLIE